MMPPVRLLIVAFALATLAAGGLRADPAAAQDRTQRISFPAGGSSQSVVGTIRGRDGAAYLINLRAGQRLSVRMRTDNDSNYFNVLPPGGGREAVFIGSASGNSADLTVRRSGDYRIEVYLMRNAARRGEQADYRLSVSAAGGSGSGITTPDDDGFTGGPDFWEVANVPPGDRLNVRTAPSAQAPVVVRVRNGTILRNLGCSLNGQTRWCRVERRNGRDNGWVAGRFLIESGG